MRFLVSLTILFSLQSYSQECSNEQIADYLSFKEESRVNIEESLLLANEKIKEKYIDVCEAPKLKFLNHDLGVTWENYRELIEKKFNKLVSEKQKLQENNHLRPAPFRGYDAVSFSRYCRNLLFPFRA